MFLFGPRDVKNASVSAQVNANEGMTISDYKKWRTGLAGVNSIRLSEGPRSSVETLTEGNDHQTISMKVGIAIWE